MTLNEKDILLKDLCARLPYGVEVEYKEEKYKISIISICNETITIYREKGYPIEVEIEKVKPYLFPLSSMTEEQKREYHELISGFFGASALISIEGLADFFNRNHIDYRCLIPMGLADDATGLNIY